MGSEPLFLHVFRDPMSGFRFNLYAATRTAAAAPLVFKERDPAMRTEPFASLEADEAQMLMDALWTAGVRPTEGAGSAGERAAMEKHLNDMRRIAFLHLDGGKP